MGSDKRVSESPLQHLLSTFRDASVTEREKGTYFEELTVAYLRHKMKFGKTEDPETGKSVADKSVVVYNPHITIRNIPQEAYTYIVNGKPALEWVMDRQRVTTDKNSGITNDANHYATETLHNPKYPLELFLRIITVSLETMKVVDRLPGLGI